MKSRVCNVLDERELVRRLTEGDEDAFAQLYSKYKNRLVFFAVKFVKSSDFAQDLFQEAFVAVWENRKFIDPDRSFSAYLYTILQNRILNELRQIRNNAQLTEQVLSNTLKQAAGTEQELFAKELESMLSEAKSKMTIRQRQIFELSREKNLSHKEIATQLDITINTVQEHISAALKIIRNSLSSHYPDSIVGMLLVLLCMNIK